MSITDEIKDFAIQANKNWLWLKQEEEKEASERAEAKKKETILLEKVSYV